MRPEFKKFCLHPLVTMQLFLWSCPWLGAEAKWMSTGECRATQADVAPNGKLAVYVRQCGSKAKQVWVKFIEDNSAGVKVSNASGDIVDPSFTPDSQSLIYSRKLRGVYKVFRQELKSNQKPEQLTFGEGNDHHPQISPNGRYLAFDSDRSGNFDIWVMQLENREATQLTQWKRPDFDPSWSSDSSRLVYTSLRSGAFNLFMRNLSVPQALPVQLTQSETAASHADVATSGLVYEATIDGRAELQWLSLDDYSVYAISEDACKPSRPRVGASWLVYQCESPGLFGIRKYALPENPEDGLQPVQTQSKIVQVQKRPEAHTAPDFETEMQRITASRESTSPRSSSDFFSDFEGYDFDLSFLSEKSKTAASPPAVAPSVQSVEPLSTPSNERVEPDQELIASLQEETVAPVLDEPKARETEPQGFDQWIQPSVSVELPVAATIPPNDAKDVPVFTPIAIILEEPTQEIIDLMKEANLYAEGKLVNSRTQWVDSQDRLDIIPEQKLTAGTLFEIRAGRFKTRFKTAGMKVKSRPKSSRIAQTRAIQSNKLSLPLRVARVFPGHRSRNVAVDAPIHVTFNQKLDPDSLHPLSVELFANSQRVPGEMVFEQGDKMLSLKPYRNLAEATVYEIRLDENLQSPEGEKLEGATRLQFKTRHFEPFLIEEFPPQILDHSDQPVVFKMNRPVDPDSLNAEEFFLKSGRFRYRGKVDLSRNRQSLRFRAYQSLPNNRDLKFYVSTRLKDRDGNVVGNARPMPMSTRFTHRKGHEQMVAARPLSNQAQPVQVKNEDLQFLRSLRDRGILSGPSLESVLTSQEPPTRYRIAQILEEALMDVQNLSPKGRQKLMQFSRRYDAELRNLGLDLDRIFQKGAVQKPVGRQTSLPSADFESRARQL